MTEANTHQPKGLSEAFLRGLGEVTCWGIVTTDAHLNITGWNRWLEINSEIAAEAVLGRSILEVFPDVRARRMERYFEQALGGQMVMLAQRLHNYLLPLPLPVAGTEFSHMQQSVRIAPLIEGEAVVGTLTVIEDVTERVLHDAELRTQARRQAALAALSQGALAGTDIAGFLDELVAVVTRSLGLEHCQVLERLPDDQGARLWAGSGWSESRGGLAPADLGPDSLAGFVLQAAEPVLVEDWQEERRFPIPRLLQEQGIRSVLAVPFGVGARPFGMLGVYATSRRTFTEEEIHFVQAAANVLGMAVHRKRLEEELRGRMQELGEADRRKDEFLAMLAHELRSPLAPIRNAMQVLRVKRMDNAEARWASDVIDRQVQQLTRLVDDLLDIARITRGKINLQREPADLAVVVARAVEISRPLIDSHRHALTVALPPGPLWLEADVARLAQVIANLMNNAAKYTEDGGQIWLTVERASEHLLVKVRDTGVGITKEMLPRVFDLFTQVDRSLDRSQGGLGIGLTLVRSLVEMHGGSVQVFSEGSGRGSEFVVRLPSLAEPQRLPQATADAWDVLLVSPSRRILVVDDNPDSADSLAMLLRITGNEVHVAYSASAALEDARKRPPEVVFLDIGLPGMSGYEVARRLREEYPRENLLLIALSGYGQDEDRRQSREAGIDHHLIKPADPESLQRVLARSLPLKQRN